MRPTLRSTVLLTVLSTACAAAPMDTVEPQATPSTPVAPADAVMMPRDAGPATDSAAGDADELASDSHSDAEAGTASEADGANQAESDSEGEGEYDDGAEDPADWESKTWQELSSHPLEKLTHQELIHRLHNDMASLGPMVLGRIHGGALINGVQMPESEGWTIRQPNASWGTQETIDAIGGCITKVRERHADTATLTIGHLSRKRGGRFPPHVSHQNGRDVDLSYYYNGAEPWYTRANGKNLDNARTWELVRCFVTDTDVELILIDRSLQRVLREHALEIGEDSHWLDQIFGGKTATLRPLIRHASGHATHIHVRFYSPVAVETGRRLYQHLIRVKAIKAPTEFVYHRAKKGHTVAYMARRYRVSQRAIKRANRMRRSTLVRIGKIYRIPRSAGVKRHGPRGPFKIPPRRLPPARSAVAESEGRPRGKSVNVAP